MQNKFSKEIKIISFITVSLIFSFLVYLSIPALYKFDNIKPELEKRILNEFRLKVRIKGKSEYLFFPSPRIIFENVEIISLSNNNKFRIDSEKIVIGLSVVKLMGLENLKFKSLSINNNKFIINFYDINIFKEISSNKLSTKPVYFNNTKIFLMNKDTLIFILSLKKFQFYLKDNINKLKFSGKLFNTDIVGQYSKSFDNLINTKFFFTFPKFGFKIKSQIENRSSNEQDGENIFGNTIIRFPKSVIDLRHKLSNNLLEVIDSNLDTDSLNGQLLGKINLNPFYFNMILNLDSFYIFQLINNDLINNVEISELFPVNNKINGNLKVNIKKIKSKSKFINSATTDLEFKNGFLYINDLELNLNKIGKAQFNGVVFEKKNKRLNFRTILNFQNQKKFYSKFVIPKKKRVNLSLVKINGNFFLDSNEIVLNEVFFKKELEENKLEELNEKLNLLISENTLNDLLKFSTLKLFVSNFFEKT